MHGHEAWFSFATDDIKASVRLINDPHEPLIPPALVLAQQAAEKALKSYLYAQNHTAIKTHDLEKLVELCMDYDPHFEQLLHLAESLNPHISASRYPDACFVIPDLGTARMLVQEAQQIYDFVSQRIS